MKGLYMMDKVEIEYAQRPYPRAYGEWDMDTDYWRGWIEISDWESVPLGEFETLMALQDAMDAWACARDAKKVTDADK